MSRRNWIWVLGAVALLVVVSCGGDSGAGERAELQSAVATLQQDMIALRTDFAAKPVARDTSDSKEPHQETSPGVERLEREITELIDALGQ